MSKINNELIKCLLDLNDSIKKLGDELKMSNDQFLYRDLEDGIIEKAINASPEQLENFIKNYRFQFYAKYNNDRDLLRQDIMKKIRNKKLDEIIK